MRVLKGGSFGLVGLLLAGCATTPSHPLPPASGPGYISNLMASEVTQAVQAGARGYLLKESAGAELLEAIAAVASGKSYFSPAVAQVVFDDYVKTLSEKGITDPYDLLSEREREVLQLVAEGRSSKEIAELLSISPATVETHRAHIQRYLDLGFDRVYLHGVSRDQAAFLEVFGREVLPKLSR